MIDERKTKKQLIQELEALRQHCAELETITADWAHTSESLPRPIDLNEIIQNMVEGIFVMDSDGYITFVNPASATLLGREVEEMIGIHWSELVPPDHYQIVEAAGERRAQGISDRYELDLLRKDGERVRIQVSGSPRVDPVTGRFIGTLSVLIDLTERLQVERELRKHRHRLEELIEERTNALKQANTQLQREISEREKAQEEINRQKEYFEALFLNNPIAVVTADMDISIISWNPMAEKLFGYTADDVIGRNLDEVVTGDKAMREEAIEYSKQAILQGQFGASTKRARKDGSLVDVEILALPVIVAGERVGFIALYHDITDRVQAEAELLMYQEQLEELVEERTSELRESEERYRTLFDGVPIGLYRSTPAGQNMDINLAAVQMLGFPSREKLLATSPKTYYVNLEDRERWVALMEQEGVVRDFEAQFRRHDGPVIWVNDTARAVMDEDDRVLYYEGSLEDITERKQAEEELRKYQEHLEELVEERTSELRESEERYRTLFDGVPVGLYRTTPAGEILDVNLAFVEIVGVSSREEILKTTDTSSFYENPEEQVRWRALMEREGVVRDFETKGRRLDGTVAWFSDTARAVKDKQGQVLYYEGRLEDITERKHAEEELRQAKLAAEAASQAKSTFLANMSHELRTPLNAIIGFTRLVKRRSKDVLPQKQLENLDKVLVSADNLLGLINDVLDLSKIEAGRVEVHPGTFNLERLIDDCLRTVQPLIKTEDITLMRNVEGDLSRMSTDEDKVRQILINLLSNAIKFTEAGTITVSGRSQEDSFVLRVADTGIGIPKDALDRIFEEFQQVDSSTTREYGGTGLGLSISRHLANLLGGDITVESAVGEGSTFTVTIPVQYENN
jgi:PAS domain S-box-containing protein